MPPTPISVRSGADPAAQQPHDVEGALGEGRPGQPAGADLLDPRRRGAQPLAGDRGVGGDDAVEADRAGEVGDREDVVVAEVGGDLDQQRDPALGDRVGRPAYVLEQRPELLDGLQVAQPRGVRRAHVDHEVVGVRRQQPGALLVVGEHRGLVVVRHDLGLADVHPQHHVDPSLVDALGRRSVAGRAVDADPSQRWAASRRATTSAPSLLKPIRLITARSSGRRNSRGVGFPGWPSPVTVPISTWPKPSAASASTPTAFLSKPGSQPQHVRERQAHRLDR